MKYSEQVKNCSYSTLSFCLIKKGTATSCPVKVRQSPLAKNAPAVLQLGALTLRSLAFETGDFSRDAKSSVNFRLFTCQFYIRPNDIQRQEENIEKAVFLCIRRSFFAIIMEAVLRPL